MAKQLRIGFIQATNEIDVQWYRPLSFGYLKTYLDTYLGGAAEMHYLDSLEEIGTYDIIGISSTSQDFCAAKEIAATIKGVDARILVILGGHHITYLPETLSEEFDLGVLGEGEETFLEVIRYVSAHPRALIPDDLKTIQGIVFREHGTPVITPRRAPIAPLDTIPFPFRSQQSVPYLFSSRGCPYQCAFCSSSAFWGRTRFFSAEYVVSEIEHILANFPKIAGINIWDDLFLVDRVRFKKIVHLLEIKEIHKRVSLSFSVRANLVNDELCADLKRINIGGTSFGAESGSDRILKILKKGTTREINQRALDTLHAHGIPVSCSFIVGVPTETEDEVRSTYEFILKNIIDGKISPRCSVNILMPMPGTEIWDLSARTGAIDIHTMDWRRLSVFASFRDSSVQDFSEWVEHRRANNSIYLAEDTLPQKRLYELMYVYENAIKAFDSCRDLREEKKALRSMMSGKTWRVVSAIRRAAGLLGGN